MSAVRMINVVRLAKRIWHSNDNTDEGLAGECLKKGRSFQLSAVANEEKLLGFKELYRAAKRLLSKPNGIERLKDAGAVLLVSNFKNQSVAKDYVELSANEQLGAVISRDVISGQMRMWSIDFIAFLGFSLSTAMACLFSKSNRVNKALLIREIALAFQVCSACEEMKVKRIYNFVPFEIDSNFLSLLLKKLTIEVIYIPSSGPLGTWNRKMICDKVVFSTPYHLEELAIHKGTMRFKEILWWGPERSHLYIDKYLNSSFEVPEKTLGFYSHGSWLRSALQHTSTEMDLHFAEEKVLENIATFLSKHTDFSLVIFLHPREKNEKYIEKSRAYYSQLFAGLNWKFAPAHLPSSNQFEVVSIGVSTFSTIIYERLFCGFKMLIGNHGISNFPIAGSSLNSICFDEERKLEELILSSVQTAPQEFFNENDLSNYRHPSLRG